MASSSSSSAAAAADNSFYVVAGPSEWKKNLITKEDPNHVHKTLGILALVSFVYRFSQFGESDLGFATHPHLTIPTLLLHLALNASSFEFKIPKQRITSGYRIWPEYRLHSLIFACRSLAFMALFWLERELGLEQPNHFWNLVIVLGTMAAAEYASQNQGKYRSGFSRELDVSAGTRYFFSVAQLGATSMCLIGQRRYTMQFLMVTIIQGNAFLMTMRRKNLASHYLLIAIYGLTLAFGAFIMEPEYRRGAGDSGRNAARAVAFLSTIAAYLRTGPRLPLLRHVQDNKFALWICIYVFLDKVIRPHLDDPETPTTLWLGRSTIPALIGLGVYKHRKEQQPNANNRKVIKKV